MTQIEYILGLLPKTNPSVTWLLKAKEILGAADARAVYEKPGDMAVRDILANSKIHLQTLNVAGCKTIGLEESIEALSRLNLDDKLLCFGFASDSLRVIGSCYVTNNGEIIGCEWIPYRERP